MKIEMCESLAYSWLRHVRGCQLVQLNWKPSPTWPERGELANLNRLVATANERFGNEYSLMKCELPQFLKQAEIDALGIRFDDGRVYVHTVEVAFHKDGLLYGSGRKDTVAKVLSKLIRSALCIVQFLGETTGELVFASPKVNKAVLDELVPRVVELNRVFAEAGMGFVARLIVNDDFNEEMLQPTTSLGGDVSDTAELLLRSSQLLKAFDAKGNPERSRKDGNA